MQHPWETVTWHRYQKMVQTPTGQIHTVDYGEKGSSAMIFIHGLSGRWQNWLPNIAYFGQQQRVIAMDLPGFGRSELPQQDISISGYVKTIKDLCNELAVEKATVIGNSMGGAIASELAINNSDFVDKLVLVSAAGISTERFASNFTTTLLRGLSSFTGIYGRWIATHAQQIAARPKLRKLALGMVNFDGSAVTPALAVQQLRGAGTPGFLDAALAILSYSLRDKLHHITTPTLIVWGQHDRIIPVSDAAVFAAGIPNSQLKIYEQTGHMAMLEQPAWFHRDVELFLTV